SRDFFVAMLALSQDGILNEESISAMAETMGQKVIAEPLPDKYLVDQILIENEVTIESMQNYYRKIIDLLTKYTKEKDLGKEITLISIGIGGNDKQALLTTKSIAKAYRDLAKEIMEIKTIDILAESHLQMANSSEKIADSIEGLTLAIEDPLTALRSLINYQRYSDEFLEVINLNDYE
ncbi:MAG: hypothetical protein PHC31_11555, partial [Clostridia bacterium]|nr:hypothetical protein [Clostridia bacterium]